ncbi:MAG: tetratricopeptide repeat protein [Desulfobacterales bacterium]|nr:tetratricopeptide repeat protein [Desulfobacterales bacterium]
MAAKTRITKKKLKKPDEFITWGSRAMAYGLSHITYILLGVLLVAAIVVASFFWRQHQAAGEEMAFTLLGKGITLYEQEGTHEHALPVFSELIKDYPRTKPGKVALLYRGRGYMLQQDYDHAIADFDLFLKRSSEPFLRAIALNALGNSYWAQGKYQQAIDCFQRVIASGDEWLKPYILVQMGMCWEKLGDKKKAIEAYQESFKLLPSSPWGTVAKTRLQKLGGKIE